MRHYIAACFDGQFSHKWLSPKMGPNVPVASRFSGGVPPRRTRSAAKAACKLDPEYLTGYPLRREAEYDNRLAYAK
jgi:hypothetical protein